MAVTNGSAAFAEAELCTSATDEPFVLLITMLLAQLCESVIVALLNGLCTILVFRR